MSVARESLALPAGTVVGDYCLERVHTAWGFYLVYLAVHATSKHEVAVLELLPEELVSRSEGGAITGRSKEAEKKLAWATERFVREGDGLAACPHPALPKPLAVFEANGTAYWVIPREENRNFKSWLQGLNRAPTEAELKRLLVPLLAGLERAHGTGLFHLNLKPETIQLDAQGRPSLIRFSGARQAIARHGHEAGAVTTGYSPPEQYVVEKLEGPWTDIYSLAAVLHRAISGQAPPEADQRVVRDSFQPLASRYSASYRHDFLAAIDAALAPEPADRPQSIAGWRAMLGINVSGRSMPLRLGAAVVAMLTLAVGVWLLFPKPVPPPPPPGPDDGGKGRTVQNDSKTDDGKTTDEKAKAEAEEKSAEEQRRREEAQKEKERQLAENKTEQQKMAANEDAAAKAEAERLAAEKMAQLAQKAADAAAQAEAAKRAAEEAARMAAPDPVKRAAAEKAAADAAAEAALKKEEAEQAAKLAAEAQRKQEMAEQQKIAAEQNKAKRMGSEEAARRQEAEMAAQKVQAGAEKRAQEQAMPPDPGSAARMAAEKAAAEKMAAERASAEQAAMQWLAAEKAAAEQAAARAAAEKAAMEKMAAEKAAAEKARAEAEAAKAEVEKKAEAEKMAANQKADPNAGKYKSTGVEGATESDDKTPKKGSGGGAVSGIPGIWETTATDAGGKPRKRLIIYDDGRYLISDNTNWKDAGVILANGGRIQMMSDATKIVVRSSYRLRTLSKIVTAGALGEEEWTRVERSPGSDPNRPKE